MDLQSVEFLVANVLQRVFDLFLRHEAVMLGQLLGDVAFVVPLQVIVSPIVLDHLHVHVRHAETENFIFVFGVGNLRDRVLQHIVPDLVIKVVVSVFVEAI